MKRILIVTLEYFPNNSSNTTCFYPYIEKMLSQGYRVDVICSRLNHTQKKYEIINKVHVHRIDDYRIMNTALLNELVKINSPAFLKFMTTLFSYFSKTLYYLKYCLGSMEKRYAGWDYKKAVAKTVALNKDSPFDVVISISSPLINHSVANSLKFLVPNIKWYIFEFDLISYNSYLYSSRQCKRLSKKEAAWYSKSDNVFLTPEIYAFYKSNHSFLEYQNKFVSQNYANLTKNEKTFLTDKSIDLSNNKMNLVYGGALSPSLRNPKYLFNVLTLTKQCHLTIMTNADISFLDTEKNFDNISVLPGQDYEIYYSTLNKADILVSIGNSNTIQMPGKVLEYIALGKPIVHFSSLKNDPCLSYYKSYPLALIIYENEEMLKENAALLDAFCLKHTNEKLSFTQIEELFPDFISSKVTDDFISKFIKS